MTSPFHMTAVRAAGCGFGCPLLGSALLAVAACTSAPPVSSMESAAWRLAVEADGSFSVELRDYPVAQDLLVSSTSTGVRLPTSSANPTHDSRCGWTYARHFAWASSLGGAWQTEPLSEEEWTRRVTEPSPGPTGSACGGSPEFWDVWGAARAHEEGAQFTCRFLNTTGAQFGRCTGALSHLAAASDLAVMLSDDWRVGMQPTAATQPGYVEEVWLEHSAAGLVIVGVVNVRGTEARVQCSSRVAGADASIGVEASLVAALRAVEGTRVGREIELPDLAMRWRGYDLARRLSDDSVSEACYYGQPGCLQGARELASRVGGWDCDE